MTSSLVRRILAVTGFAMFASLSVAQAQLEESFKFTTTFPFTVGNATLPAGSYTITPDEDAPAAFCIIEGKGVKMFFEIRSAETAQAPAKSEAVFTRFGQGYVLKNVWVEGSAEGIETTVAEPERHHIKRGGATSQEHVPAANAP
ncbi:MAG TPA: hypothetical protein VF173_02340 [Thermoanaerobaculia bacterium]|nr:hypothetical protein [Thermoanaerobaculia bacterium]